MLNHLETFLVYHDASRGGSSIAAVPKIQGLVIQGEVFSATWVRNL